MKTPVFTGAGVAIITPFKNGAVNYEKFGELLDMQIEGGTRAIIVCGTTGESATLSLEEHAEAVDFAVKYIAGRATVIAGSGSNDTNAALFLSQSAEKSGADALLMVTPYYNKATQLGLIKHYNFVADRVNIPIILYNVPSRTGVGFTADTYKELSKHPMINGVKEASGDLSLVVRTRALCGDDLYFWSGNDDQTIPIMSVGGKGSISVLSNFLPHVVSDICDLCLANDFKAAMEIQNKYTELMDAMFIEVNPTPVKIAMNLLGMDVGELRMPLCEMLPQNLEKLKSIMRAHGLKLVCD